MINGVGDIVCVTPALQVLKSCYPEAETSVIVRPHLGDLLRGLDFVDRVFEYEVGPVWKRVTYLAALRRERFDLWVDLHMPTFNTMSSNTRDFLRNALLMRASGARFRLGYALPALAPHLTHRVTVPDPATLRGENIVDTTVALIDPFARGRYRKHVPITADDDSWAATALPGDTPLRIALYFGSRQSADLWPDAHILELVELLATRLPRAELLLIGAEHEADLVRRLGESLAKRAPSQLRNFIGRTSFGQTAALLRRCRAFIGTDSGATHIADAVGLPIIALFSSKNHPAIWQPISQRLVVLNQPVPCGPCYKADCNVGNRCMALITPQSVLDALLRLIGPV